MKRLLLLPLLCLGCASAYVVEVQAPEAYTGTLLGYHQRDLLQRWPAKTIEDADVYASVHEAQQALQASIDIMNENLRDCLNGPSANQVIFPVYLLEWESKRKALFSIAFLLEPGEEPEKEAILEIVGRKIP